MDPALPLGLTFSFPVEQTALNEGKILTWTKGFAAKNAVGHDVVQLLQDAFNRKHLHVRCVALVNDVSAVYNACLFVTIVRCCRLSEPCYLVHTLQGAVFLVRIVLCEVMLHHLLTLENQAQFLVRERMVLM